MLVRRHVVGYASVFLSRHSWKTMSFIVWLCLDTFDYTLAMLMLCYYCSPLCLVDDYSTLLSVAGTSG